MERSGQIVNAKRHLALPCLTWVSTGACPFGRRCGSSESAKFIISLSHRTEYCTHRKLFIIHLFIVHDPFISGPLEYPSWLPAATGNTNAHIIIDRFAAHRESSMHQENCLIPQSCWEICHSDETTESEWINTYNLVCNMGVNSFSGRHAKNVHIEKISHFQKLCIVLQMRDGLEMSQLYRDYIFAPTHSIHSELCMLLQTRYFIFPPVGCTTVAELTADSVAREISIAEYNALRNPCLSAHGPSEQGQLVIVYEVAFGPKGQHDANLSLWFNTPAIKLEPSQIKRCRRLKQKKKAQIRNEHTHPNANGALISRTCSADFPNCDPDIR